MLTTIEQFGAAVSAGEVHVGDEFACIESEKRDDPRRTLTVTKLVLGHPRTAICVSAREGMKNTTVRIALYRLINPTKFRHFRRPGPLAEKPSATVTP